MRAADLDRLERRALEAWAPPEGCVPADFVERVVPLEPGRSGRRWSGRPWLPLGFVAAVAVGGAAAYLGGSAHERPMPTVEPTWGGARSIVSPTPPVHHEAGTTSEQLPVELGAHIREYVGAHGRRYGPAFRFQGVILVGQGEHVAFYEAFGRASPERPLEPESRLAIGSLTQPLTAAAVLRLAARGELALEDRLGDHLPAYPGPGADATIAQLLSHTSGIPNYADDLEDDRWLYAKHTLGSLSALFTRRELEFAPGTDFDPSNSGYVALGMLLEHKAGKPFEQVMVDEVFEPLGMADTSVGVTFDQDMALGFEFREDETLDTITPRISRGIAPAAGVVTTARDFMRFHRGLQDGTLLGSEWTERMQEPVRKSYALGWAVAQGAHGRMAMQPGGLDGYNAAAIRYLDRDVVVVILTNSDVHDARRVAHDVADMAFGVQVDPPIEHEEILLAPSLMHAYGSRYGLSEALRKRLAEAAPIGSVIALDNAFVYLQDDRLFLHLVYRGAKWMHPMGRDRFFFKDEGGTTARFLRDPSTGRVQALELVRGLERVRLERRRLDYEPNATPEHPREAPASDLTRAHVQEL